MTHQSYSDPTYSGQPDVMSATTLIGDRVRNMAGEDLGKVEEIMIDMEGGRVAYAVLSFGGVLGLGNKLFAVPWEALTVDTEEHKMVLNVDHATLENAPGFDKDNWPGTEGGKRWLVDVYDYYGYEPYWDR
jgi:sporulation protein YlmC with PRC-barrel domain